MKQQIFDMNYVRENFNPEELLDLALKLDDLEIFKLYLQDNFIPQNINITKEAVEMGSIEILKYLYLQVSNIFRFSSNRTSL